MNTVDAGLEIVEKGERLQSITYSVIIRGHTLIWLKALGDCRSIGFNYRQRHNSCFSILFSDINRACCFSTSYLCVGLSNMRAHDIEAG